MAASLAKIPMTSVRRLISRFTVSSGFLDAIRAPCFWGVGGENVLAERFHENARLFDPLA